MLRYQAPAPASPNGSENAATQRSPTRSQQQYSDPSHLRSAVKVHRKGNETTMSLARSQLATNGNQSHLSDEKLQGPGSGTMESTRSTTSLQLAPFRLQIMGQAPHIPCVNCHKHWWDQSCEGQPCTNCQKYGTDCQRPRCENFVAGSCAKGYKCKQVHGDDPRYNDDTYLISLLKLPRRMTRKSDAKLAPSVLAKGKET